MTIKLSNNQKILGLIVVIFTIVLVSYWCTFIGSAWIPALSSNNMVVFGTDVIGLSTIVIAILAFFTWIESKKESQDPTKIRSRITPISQILKKTIPEPQSYEHFYGRKWFFPKIDEWLKEKPQSRVLWIYGNPGIGKSAIAAQVCQNRSDVIAFHFFDYKNEDKSSTRLALLSIISQIALNLPEYSKRLSDLDIERETHKSPQTIFDNLIIEPLSRNFPTQSFRFILLDALDEAERDGKNEMADIIRYQWEKTPQWLKLIVFSRPEAALQNLENLAHLHPTELDAHSDDNLQDIQNFLKSELRKRKIPYTKEQIQKIADNSEGIFLYVTEVLNRLDDHDVSLSEVMQWPKGMYGLYQSSFTRIFPSIEEYQAYTRPILDCICAARGSLPFGLLTTAVNDDEFKLKNSLSKVKSFFNQVIIGDLTVVVPFHKSIYDWLVSENEPGAFVAGNFAVDVKKGQELLAKVCYENYKNSENIFQYTIRYLPDHLVEINNNDEYLLLMYDIKFISRKVKIFGPYEMIRDYNLCSRLSLSAEDKTDLLLIRDAFSLSSHILSQDPNQYPTQLIGRLSSFDNPRINSFVSEVKKSISAPALIPVTCTLIPPGGLLIRTLEGHSGSVYAVAITPDGRHAVSGSYDKTLKIWDLNTGKIIRPLEGHSGSVYAVAITPDGHRAVSGSYDNSLKIWDLDTGNILRTLEGHSRSVTAIAITPDGRHAVSGSYDKTLKIWDLYTWRNIRSLEGHSDWVTTVAITPDGRHAVSGSYDKTLKIWDLDTGNVLISLEGHSRSVTAIAITPDGRHAVSSSYDKTLKIWDLYTWRNIRSLKGHSDWVTTIAITPDGHRAVSGSDDKTLKVWDLDTGNVIRSLEGHSSPVTTVAITPDGHHAVSGSHDKTLKVWDLDTGRIIRTPRGHSRSVTAIAITPDGRRAISGSYDNSLKIWDLDTGNVIRSLEGYYGAVTAIAITPDGHHAVSGSYDNSLKIWDLDTGNVIRSLEGHSSPVTTVAITPDGHHAVSGSYDNSLKIWDLDTGNVIRSLEGYYGAVTAVAITPNGRRVVSSSCDKTLRVWDLDTGNVIRSLEGYYGAVTAVAITPNGRRVVSGSGYSTLKVWDLDTGNILRTLEGHSSPVTTVAITPDGCHAVSGSGDNTLKVWDLDTGNILRTLEGHSSPVTTVAITPDGRHAVSGSGDNTLKVWDLDTGNKIIDFFCDGNVISTMCSCDNVIVAGDSLGNIHILKLILS
jgi:WD40 repeat protein